ncbi:hypothetical protein OH492_03505 [Vibrio chagasii]|nr:hypothetical protein [Vibrio chagasii]
MRAKPSCFKRFPQFNEENFFDAEIVEDIEWVKTFITAIRNLRAEYDIAPSKGLEVMIKVARKTRHVSKQTR